MNKGLIVILGLCVPMRWSVGQPLVNQQPSYVRFVNPLIGTSPSTTKSALMHGTETENSAQVIPEVTLPFGMTNWTPETRRGESKCVAPYYYGDSVITGFRGSHWLSGSCTQDYGSVTLMPFSHALRLQAETRGSRYSHSSELATPYYYTVLLKDDGIQGDMTATKRCGFCRFSFEDADTAFIIVEPNSDYGEGYVRITPEQNEIAGYNPVHRIYQGWGEPAGFRGYFVAQFSEPFSAYGVYEGAEIHEGANEIGGRKGVGGFARFVSFSHRRILVRIGTSFTSLEEARSNLAKETGGVSLDSAKADLRNAWEALLSNVSVTGGSEAAKVKFYTALYHACLVPRVYNDCDGSYPSFAGGDSICNSGNGDYYCDFSLWDTYRALHPLFNLVLPDINAGMVRSLLLMARQGGWLPIFPCWNSYTSAMIGDHAIAVIADAVVKGVVALTDEEYGFLKRNATQLPANRKEYLDGKGVRALDSYMRYGYVPLDDSVKESFHRGEQVSRTLEYAYDDFALSQIAKSMGNMVDHKKFLDRSKNYRNVYNPAVGCVCGRFADGTFTTDFVKSRRMPYITEGTPWQYTWYVPHDIDGMIAMMGGRDVFNHGLDTFFGSGQYWHGNEPDQQAPFLYDYSAQPEKTQLLVRQILADEYSDAPGGLSGNDDAGQISAWYVFASMGLYPVCPSKDEYALTSPSFDGITLRVAGGRSLVIKAEGVNEGRSFVGHVDWNGTPVEGWQIRHSALVKGGTLKFTMQQTPRTH